MSKQLFLDLSNETRIALVPMRTTLTGEIVREYRKALLERFAARKRPIHLDLSQVQFLDSEMISFLMQLSQKLSDAGLPLSVGGLSETMSNLLGQMGLEKYFQFK